MQAVVPQKEQGSAVSTYVTYETIAGCLSSVGLSWAANRLGAAIRPHLYGKLIFAWQLVGNLGGLFFFWKAGVAYKKYMESRET